MRAVCAYLRTATDNEDRLAQQRALVCDLAAARGLKVQRWFIDRGISGTVDLHDRPDGAALLRDLAAGTFEKVLVQNLDRLGRPMTVVALALDAIRTAGGEVVLLEGPPLPRMETQVAGVIW
jgi:DNA invertase Pin-like site-specific DNA recombinase